jgi:hypothetical protein
MKSKLLLASLSVFLTSCMTCNLPPRDSSIDIYKSAPLASWDVLIENYETQQKFSGESTSLPKGDVTLALSDKDSTKDALNLSWKNAWRAGLTFENGTPLDLTPYMSLQRVVFH